MSRCYRGTGPFFVSSTLVYRTCEGSPASFCGETVNEYFYLLLFSNSPNDNVTRLGEL